MYFRNTKVKEKSSKSMTLALGSEIMYPISIIYVSGLGFGCAGNESSPRRSTHVESLFHPKTNGTIGHHLDRQQTSGPDPQPWEPPGTA